MGCISVLGRVIDGNPEAVKLFAENSGTETMVDFKHRSLLRPQPPTAPRFIRERPRLHVRWLNAERGQTSTHLLTVDTHMVQRLHHNHASVRLVCALVQSDDSLPVNRLA